MRKPLIVAIVSLAMASAAAGAVLAATPRAGKSYSGRGHDYYNDAPHLVTAPSLIQPVSFKVSRDGKHVTGFVGRYSWYCGGGHSTLTSASLSIRQGRFGGSGSSTTKYSVNYFVVKGQFIDGGRKATVEYQANFVTKGRHNAHPYSFAYAPPSSTCQTQVRATVTVG